MNGARSDQSNITLDGVDVNSDTKGYAFTSVLPVTADSVQEFRVTTTNYNSDAGRSSGAQVSLVTKSGTNDFHGSIYEYNRNTLTSANDYFIKQAQLESGDPNKAPELIRNNFGGSLGGPIIKQRRGERGAAVERGARSSERGDAGRHHRVSVPRPNGMPGRYGAGVNEFFRPRAGRCRRGTGGDPIHGSARNRGKLECSSSLS